MKAQIQANKAETADTVIISQLRLELEQSHTDSEEAKKLQAQQSLEIEKLKVALATGNETVDVKNEREAIQEAFKERSAE